MSDDLLYPYVEITIEDEASFTKVVDSGNHRPLAHLSTPSTAYLSTTSTADYMLQQLNRLFRYDAHLHAYMPYRGTVQIGLPSLHTGPRIPIAEGSPVEIYKQLVPHLHMMRGG